MATASMCLHVTNITRIDLLSFLHKKSYRKMAVLADLVFYFSLNVFFCKLPSAVKKFCEGMVFCDLVILLVNLLVNNLKIVDGNREL
jgi:hypothetical protein